VQHLLLVGDETGRMAGWLDAHPPLAERVRRLYGRSMGPMPLTRPDERPPVATPEAVPATVPAGDASGWRIV